MMLKVNAALARSAKLASGFPAGRASFSWAVLGRPAPTVQRLASSTPSPSPSPSHTSASARSYSTSAQESVRHDLAASSAELEEHIKQHGLGLVQGKYGKNKGKVTCRSVNQAMQTLLREEQASLALQLFDSMEARWGVKPDAHSYASALRALDKLSRWEEAIALFDQLDQLKIPKDTVMYNTAIHILGKAGQWRHAYALFRELGPRADAFSRQSVMSALSNRSPQSQLLARLKAEFAVEEQEYDLAYTHQEADVPNKPKARAPHLYSKFIDFKDLNRAAITSGDYSAAVLELSQCIQKGDLGLLSSSGAITEAFKLFGNAGRADMVLSVLESLKQHRLPLTVQNCNNALNALVRSNNAAMAIELFESMESQWRLKPDAISCGTAIRAYDEQGRWRDAVHVFGRLGTLGVPKDAVIYTSMIKMLGKAGQWRQAYGMFREMGELADKASQNAIVRVMEKASQPKILQGLIQEFSSQEKKSVNLSETPQAIDFAALDREAASTGDFSSAAEAAATWLEAGKLTPGGVTWCFSVFGHARRPDKVQSLITMLDKLGVHINTAHCNAAMTAFNRCNESSKALEVLNLMEPRWSLEPDSYTYVAALNAYDQTGMWEEALTLFEVLSDRGLVQKSAYIYNSMIVVLGNAGKWEKALQLFREMGALADQHSRNAICTALENSDRKQLVQALRAEFGMMPSTCTSSRGNVFTAPRQSSAQGSEGRIRSAVGAGAGSLPAAPFSSEDVTTEAEADASQLLLKLMEKPDSASFLVQFLGMTEQTESIQHVLDEMDAQSLLRNGLPEVRLTHTYNTAILACGNAGDADQAFVIFHRMLANGVPRTRNTYECLIRIAAAFSTEEQVAYVKKKAAEDKIVISNPYFHF